MKKPNIIKISNKRADQYRDELRELEVAHPQDELGRIAFKDGYDFALDDFSVPDMVDALIDIKKQIKNMKNTDFVTGISERKINKALKKAGCIEGEEV